MQELLGKNNLEYIDKSREEKVVEIDNYLNILLLEEEEEEEEDN